MPILDQYGQPIDKGVLRGHQKVVTAQGEGEITSGSFSPTLQQSIALARLPLQIICNAGIAGVFQIRDHQTDRACASCTQASSDRIRMIVVLSHHSHHLFDRFIAYAVLLRFAINHIARGGS